MAKLEILPKRVDYLEVGDPTSEFRINIDILNEAFGVGRSMYARACYPDKKNTWIKGNNPDDKIALWMAKLYGNSSEWANSISADGKTIYEIAESTRETDWTHSTESDFIRIAFLKESPKSPYKFVGVFENENMDFLKHSYRRIATKIKLIGDPVTEVQLLDDIR